jgi:hypothetical protein
MKTVSTRFSTEVRRRGFTLTELMIAFGVGLPVAGAVVLLFVQAAFEQRRGLADTTVEENAYVLQARITSCLRSMSSSGGLTTSNAVQDYPLFYQTINGFHANPTNGFLTREQISFDPSSGQVTYTPDMSASANQIVWMKTNSPTVALRQLYFYTSGSDPNTTNSAPNNTLVHVCFQMDDNGYSRQGTINNLANIERKFSVQMRSD